MVVSSKRLGNLKINGVAAVRVSQYQVGHGVRSNCPLTSVRRFRGWVGRSFPGITDTIGQSRITVTRCCDQSRSDNNSKSQMRISTRTNRRDTDLLHTGRSIAPRINPQLAKTLVLPTATPCVVDDRDAGSMSDKHIHTSHRSRVNPRASSYVNYSPRAGLAINGVTHDYHAPPQPPVAVPRLLSWPAAALASRSPA